MRASRRARSTLAPGFRSSTTCRSRRIAAGHRFAVACPPSDARLRARGDGSGAELARPRSATAIERRRERSGVRGVSSSASVAGERLLRPSSPGSGVSGSAAKSELRSTALDGSCHSSASEAAEAFDSRESGATDR